MKHNITWLATAAAIAVSAPALAASDFLLEIDGIDGESAAPMAVDDWSFGACNAGQCTTITSPRDLASGQASGKAGSPTRAGWDLATNKGGRMAAASPVVGDLDGDGHADFAYAGTLNSIQALTFTFDKASPQLARFCTGKHFTSVTLRRGADSLVISGASVTCTAATPSAARTIDQTPARISTNMTTARQTQGATFGERCIAGQACAGGAVTMTFTGGQMKHTKSGHVTLLK